MDLSERGESQAGGAESGLEAATIFEDVFAGVPIGETEVKYFSAVEFADAAGSRTEAVDDPGKFAEGLELEDAQAAGGGQDPGPG